MTDFYLITGFLGAGKTTFLQEFVCLFQGKRLTVIMNEFGKADVDGVLLNEQDIKTTTVEGGSVFCSCRSDQFEAVLTKLMKTEPDVIITEASGLSDPTCIRKILEGHSNGTDINYKGCICLADALRFEKVYTTALSVKKQLTVCGAVVLNKTDAVGSAALAKVRGLIRALRPDVPILETSFGAIRPEWEPILRNPAPPAAEDGVHTQDFSIRSYLLLLPKGVDKEAFVRFLRQAGTVCHRIKGFAVLCDRGGQGETFLIDCTGTDVRVRLLPQPEGAELNRVVAIGDNTAPRKLRQALLLQGLDHVEIQS